MAGNVQASQETAANATDYYYSAYINCLNDTAKKVSCLLKDSVVYGANVYRQVFGEKSIDNRIFSTRIQMMPDAIDLQKFEMMMQNALNNTPELALFVDPFQMMRIAKEDTKLAETLFRKAQKKMIQHQQQTAQQNQEATFKAQVESARTGEEEKRKTKELEGKVDLEKVRMEGETSGKTATLTLVASFASLVSPCG